MSSTDEGLGASCRLPIRHVRTARKPRQPAVRCLMPRSPMLAVRSRKILPTRGTISVLLFEPYPVSFFYPAAPLRPSTAGRYTRAHTACSVAEDVHGRERIERPRLEHGVSSRPTGDKMEGADVHEVPRGRSYVQLFHGKPERARHGGRQEAIPAQQRGEERAVFLGRHAVGIRTRESHVSLPVASRIASTTSFLRLCWCLCQVDVGIDICLGFFALVQEPGRFSSTIAVWLEGWGSVR